MRVLGRVLLLAVAVLLIVFAVSNRETVSLAFWPFPFLVEAPLYLLFFLTLLIGALIGAAAAWLAAARSRRDLRRQRRRIEALERELTATQAQLADHPAGVQPPLPAGRPLAS